MQGLAGDIGCINRQEELDRRCDVVGMPGAGERYFRKVSVQLLVRYAIFSASRFSDEARHDAIHG